MLGKFFLHMLYSIMRWFPLIWMQSRYPTLPRQVEWSELYKMPIYSAYLRYHLLLDTIIIFGYWLQGTAFTSLWCMSSDIIKWYSSVCTECFILGSLYMLYLVLNTLLVKVVLSHDFDDEFEITQCIVGHGRRQDESSRPPWNPGWVPGTSWKLLHRQVWVETIFVSMYGLWIVWWRMWFVEWVYLWIESSQGWIHLVLGVCAL